MADKDNKNPQPQGGGGVGGGGGGGGGGGNTGGAKPQGGGGGGGGGKPPQRRVSLIAMFPLLLSIVFTTVTLFLFTIGKLVSPACVPAMNGTIPAGCAQEVWIRIGVLGVVAVILQVLLYQQRNIRHPGWRAAFGFFDTFTNIIGLGWLAIYPLVIASSLRPWIDALAPLISMERVATFILLLGLGILWRGLDEALRG